MALNLELRAWSVSYVNFQDNRGVLVDPEKASAMRIIIIVEGKNWERMCSFICQSTTTLKRTQVWARYLITTNDLWLSICNVWCNSALLLHALSSPFSFCNINYHAGGTLELLLVFEILACYTLVTIYLEKTVLGDGCVGLIIEAMSTGVRINSSNLSGSKIKLMMKS